MADVKTGCLVGRDGHVRCWGLDPTAVGERPRKATPVDGLDEVVEVAVAGTYACARRRDGAVHCFDQRPQGVRRAELGDRAVAVAAGGRNVTCAALAGGDVTCLDGGAWSMSAGVHDAVDVQVGYAHRCALHRDGTISCWGANDRGQLGRPAAPGPGDDMPGPGGAARVPSVTGARAIASGTWADHVCVTRCDGEVVCWGSGRGFDVPDEAPPTTLPGAAAVEHLAVGIDFTCAAGRSGAPRCWGSRAPVTRKDPAAGPASLKRTGEVVELVAAHSTVCVLGTNELVTCWTRHDDDTIGEPTRIPGL